MRISVSNSAVYRRGFVSFAPQILKQLLTIIHKYHDEAGKVSISLTSYVKAMQT
jgi:nicotinamide mononucleotide (NMN) deamidase PncC